MSLAARLRHTITIERATRGARNEQGVPVQTWATLATVRAWVQPQVVREAGEVTGGGSVISDQLVFMMPTDIVESDRIRFGDKLLQIVAVEDAAGKGHHLEVTCLEVTLDGASV